MGGDAQAREKSAGVDYVRAAIDIRLIGVLTILINRLPPGVDQLGFFAARLQVTPDLEEQGAVALPRRHNFHRQIRRSNEIAFPTKIQRNATRSQKRQIGDVGSLDTPGRASEDIACAVDIDCPQLMGDNEGIEQVI